MGTPDSRCSSCCPLSSHTAAEHQRPASRIESQTRGRQAVRERRPPAFHRRYEAPRSDIRDSIRQFWRVAVMVSGPFGLAGDDKQEVGRREAEQAGWCCDVLSGRSAVDHTASEVQGRPPTEAAHDQEREDRPRPRPGPMPQKTNPESTGPARGQSDDSDERHDQDALELIPRPGVERYPERGEADCCSEERRSRGQHCSDTALPGHARQIALMERPSPIGREQIGWPRDRAVLCWHGSGRNGNDDSDWPHRAGPSWPHLATLSEG